MDETRRRERAGEVLSGYVSGPSAATEATARALTRVADSRAVVLVEGISDQIALETLAMRRGRDLEGDGVVIFPVGGAHAITNYLHRFGPKGAGLALAGLCDSDEAELFRRGLARAGIGAPKTTPEMARLGFHVCVEDLEDELVRSGGPGRVEALFESQGDLGSFRTLQSQPAWRNHDIQTQMRRFLGSGARRKLRYARLLVGVIPGDRMPLPLEAVLAHV